VDGHEPPVTGPPAVLSGLRVLDLSTHATGPFATQILASLGATVLKVERPPAGDPERQGEHAMFLACNRGKYSVALDLKDAAERRLLEDLTREADAFFEGFRPGVAERIGFGFERVRQLQPRVIYVSLPGFGSTGPRASMRGYDTQYRALAGDLWLNAGPDGVPRYNPASPSFDYATAMYATIGVLSALLGPRKKAVHLEVPILAAGLAWGFARLIDPAYNGGPMAAADYVFRTLDDEYVARHRPARSGRRSAVRHGAGPRAALQAPGCGAAGVVRGSRRGRRGGRGRGGRDPLRAGQQRRRHPG